MSISHPLNPCRPIHLPISYADNLVGEKILDMRRSPNHFINQVATRMTALVLPLFHLIDASRYYFKYAQGKLAGKEWIITPSETDPGINIKKYIEVANSHLKMVFKSPFICFKRPEASVLFSAKMAEASLPPKGVTYELLPFSRLGDNINQYFNAKWIGHKLGLPVIMKPFPHWDELKLSENREHFVPNGLYNIVPSIRLTERFDESTQDMISKAKGGIFEAPFLYDSRIDWSDKTFRQSIQNDLQAIHPVAKRQLKPNHINVALHFREGGTFDSKIEKHCSPTKLPDEKYYKDQILYVLDYYKGQNIHFQIFTDSTTPKKVKESLEFFTKEQMKSEDRAVSFGFDESGRDSNTATIEDMISMSSYQCLIRPDSGLSRLAGLIGAPELEIYPTHLSWEQTATSVTSIIDEVTIVVREPTKEPTKITVPTDIKKTYQGPTSQVEYILKRNGMNLFPPSG